MLKPLATGIRQLASASLASGIWHLASVLLLALPACAGTGSGGQTAMVKTQPTLRFEGKTFADSTVLQALATANGAQPFLLEFDRCTFTGPVRFTASGTEFGTFAYNAVFKDCTFEQDLLADQTQFMGRVNMVKCRFKQRAQFNNCTFMGPAGFRTCAFDGDAAFTNTLFMREASFMDTHFFEVARLQAAKFLAPVQFSNAIFHKNADLTLTRFSEGAWFDFITAMGVLDLSSARTQGPFSFRTAKVGKLLLNNLTAFEKVNLSSLTSQDSTQVAGAIFYKK